MFNIKELKTKYNNKTIAKLSVFLVIKVLLRIIISPLLIPAIPAIIFACLIENVDDKINSLL